MKLLTATLFLGLTLFASAETPKFGTQFSGQVWQVSPDAVYITGPDTTAVRVPLDATFMVNGAPMDVSQLRNGYTVTVVFPTDDAEIIAGPLPPSEDNGYFHRSIRRGPDVIDQDFVNGVWVDRR